MRDLVVGLIHCGRMDDRPQHYPSDTSDEQWAVIEPLLPAVRTGGRPEKHPRRAIVDAYGVPEVGLGL